MQSIVRRNIGVISLTAFGISSMIGSGWLFAAYYTSKLTGPYAFVSWLLVGLFVFVLGFALAEIASIFPKRGLMTRLLAISHNKDFGYTCALANWLGMTAVIPTEAEGSIQYLSSLYPRFTTYIIDPTTHQLTHLGLSITAGLMVIYFLLNLGGIKLLAKSNTLFTLFKVIVPTLTSITIIFTAFHSSNFSTHHLKLQEDLAPNILVAIITCGLVYSFNGFQTIVSFCNEVDNPAKKIPLALIFSISLTLIIYMLLQFAFIGALSPEHLKNGWHNINFVSPFVQLSTLLGLHAISVILYVDAVVSPSGTALTYVGATSRMLTAMSQEGIMPKLFSKLNRLNFSHRSLIFNTLIGIGCLWVFRSWQSLVSLLSMFHIISYMAVPLCLGKLRHIHRVGKIKFPFAKISMPILFVLVSYLFMFAQYPITLKVAIMVMIFYVIFLVVKRMFSPEKFSHILKSSILMPIYLAVLAGISAIGTQDFGGSGLISGVWFYIVTAAVALAFYYLALQKWLTAKHKPQINVNGVDTGHTNTNAMDTNSTNPGT